MKLRGVTVDTGFLVALPVAVLVEWWRGDKRQAHYLKAFDIEHMTDRLAKSAGEAIAAVSGATVVDAIVMASAAHREDVVYTSDFDDLSRLGGHHKE